MYARYLGTLPWHDPLQEVLRSRLFSGVHDPVFHVEAISDCHRVYRYHEERSRLSLRQTVLDAGAAREIRRLRDRWLGRSRMRAGEAIVHGDATPTNFLFGEGSDVVAIDLERMKRADPAWDLGMVCGELKHAFLWRTGNGEAAEPFIRVFLERYAAAFPDPGGAFRAVTRRLPLFMALTELRIARNEWLWWQHRLRLTREALACLTWGLR